MTTRRSGLIRAGVALLLAALALAVGSPAFADPVGVTVTSRFTPFKPGDTQLLRLSVGSGGAPSVTVSVSGLGDFTVDNPAGCANGGGSSCTVSFGPGDTAKDITFSITATGNIGTGQSRTDHGRVTARQNVLLGGGTATAAFDATLTGPQPTPTRAASVASVSGVVTDAATSGPLADAVVVLADSGACAPGSGRQPCQVATDGDGRFTFTASSTRPLAPGTMSLGARKDGYQQARVSVQARAGQSVTVALRLKPAAAAGSSAAPDRPSAGGQPATTGIPTPAVADAAQPSAGSGVLPPAALIFGGLLALVGAAVLGAMVLRGRRDHAYPDSPAGWLDSGRYRATTHDDQPTVVHHPAGDAMASPDGAIASPDHTVASPDHTVASPDGAATAVADPWRCGDEPPDPYDAADPDGPVEGRSAGYDCGSESAAEEYGEDPWAYGRDGATADAYEDGSGAAPTGYRADHNYHADHNYGADHGYRADHGYPRDQHGTQDEPDLDDEQFRWFHE